MTLLMRLAGLALVAGAVVVATLACGEANAWAAVVTFGVALVLLGAGISILKASWA